MNKIKGIGKYKERSTAQFKWFCSRCQQSVTSIGPNQAYCPSCRAPMQVQSVKTLNELDTVI